MSATRRRLAPVAALAAVVTLAAGAFVLWPSSPGSVEADPGAAPVATAPESAPIEAVAATPPPVAAPATPAVAAEAPESAPAKVTRTSPSGGAGRSAASPQPTTAASPPAAAAASGASLGSGSILVKSSPWGRVSIDGKQLENTPLRKEVSAGPHVVIVDCGECIPSQSQRFEVTVDAGATKTVLAKFEAAP